MPLAEWWQMRHFVDRILNLKTDGADTDFDEWGEIVG